MDKSACDPMSHISVIRFISSSLIWVTAVFKLRNYLLCSILYHKKTGYAKHNIQSVETNEII